MRSQTPVREKRRLIYCSDVWFITSTTGKEENGAILKIISKGVLTEMTVRLFEAFRAKRQSTLPQSPLAVTVKLIKKTKTERISHAAL